MLWFCGCFARLLTHLTDQQSCPIAPTQGPKEPPVPLRAWRKGFGDQVPLVLRPWSRSNHFPGGQEVPRLFTLPLLDRIVERSASMAEMSMTQGRNSAPGGGHVWWWACLVMARQDGREQDRVTRTRTRTKTTRRQYEKAFLGSLTSTTFGIIKRI